MDSVNTNKGEGFDSGPHMGSEYMDARTYLAQQPRGRSPGAGRHRATSEPQHGSNDSDFGAADQAQD